MNQTSKTIGKLLKYAGPFRITILLSAIFAAFSAVINLKSYLCVYEVAKLLIQSAGNFGAINLAAMKELGFRAVYYRLEEKICEKSHRNSFLKTIPLFFRMSYCSTIRFTITSKSAKRMQRKKKFMQQQNWQPAMNL